MAISPDDVALQSGDARGRYVYVFPDGAEAELAYTEPRAGLMALTHTYTPPSHRGQGVAAVLVERAVADARRNGSKVLPACSFAREQFALHPEWQDLAGE